MEWRRTYPVLAIKILAVIFVLSILMIPLAFMGETLPCMVAFLGIASVFAVGMAIITNRLISRDEIRYRCTVNFDTWDLIKLIRRGDEEVSRIMASRFRKDRLDVWFLRESYFIYRYGEGVIEIPRSAMKKEKEGIFGSYDLQTLIEDIIRKKKGRIHENPHNIDVGAIKREIELLNKKEIKRQMGSNKQPYIYNPATRYVNYTIIFFMVTGAVTTTGTMFVMGDHNIFELIFMGLFLGGVGGAIIWLLASYIATRIVGDHSTPVKYRLTERNLDLTNWKETRRTSIPFKDIVEVKRMWNSQLTSIRVEGLHILEAGIVSFMPDRILIRMDGEEFNKLKGKTKRSFS